MSSVTEIENRIRLLCLTKRIRIIQFFPDYDELRSGFVTASQFFRCLYQTLGLNLKKDEEELIIRKYGSLERHKINYRRFCANIDQEQLAVDDVPITVPVTSEKMSRNELVHDNPANRMTPKLHNILYNLTKYYRIHGICLKSAFKDFDIHNIGRVTESQFYRNFPRPPDFNVDNVAFLVQTYAFPNNPGLVNYLNLCNDIMNIYQKLSDPLKIPGQTQIFPTDKARYDPSLAETMQNIKIQAHKYGIRTTDFFKDYDRHQLGAITENQFLAALNMSLGKVAQLGPEEMNKIVQSLRTPDGKVRYKEFCQEIENAFTRCHLEKKPTENVFRPPIGALARGVRQLSPEKEQEVAAILSGQRERIKRRNLDLFPYFKDYDRGILYSRTVSKSQFARVLHFLQMDISDREVELLAEKFAADLGEVNYPLYIQNVDPDFVAQSIGDVLLPEIVDEAKKVIPDSIVLTLEELISRIRHICLVNRLKVSPSFEDFDPLRSGTITKSQFRRGLSMLGLSKIGFHDLTNSQFQLLFDAYKNAEHKDRVDWTRFRDDIDSVFTTFNLEKTPMLEVPPQESFIMPKFDTVEWKNASEEHRMLFDKTMKKLKQEVYERRMHIEPFFRDFDRHGNRHVSPNQFEQALAMLNLPFTLAESAALKARYMDSVGIDYIQFIQDLLPEVHKQKEPAYIELMKSVNKLDELNKMREPHFVHDLESVLLKIKTLVYQRRFRLIDFIKDYDKQNCGRVTKNQFHRALSLSPLELSGAEISILADKYQSMANVQSVDYRRFCDEVESIFTTKHLEKCPLRTIYQFHPEEEWRLNVLTQEEQESLKLAMNRIAKKVKDHRMQLFPLMEDFDREKNGSISRSHFYRVLSQIDLAHLFNDQELKTIYKKFNVRIGTRDDVDYIAFCDMIYSLAGFVYRRP